MNFDDDGNHKANYARINQVNNDPKNARMSVISKCEEAYKILLCLSNNNKKYNNNNNNNNKNNNNKNNNNKNNKNNKNNNKNINLDNMKTFRLEWLNR
ncbi:hypothetical protein ElyMa_000047300 [Elysia marginata]|uniref:Uncharacterized protein n=1 Tax=Elysia marginata TaxID=1093978 RepID=A0AAV4EFJ1_9GAST|nr:hypothetical protein ElyMa_000047300 [Elysia marginata]